jgi:hypothetical protein
MRLSLLQTITAPNGTTEESRSTIDREIVVFGRGSDCDVILSGSAFSLKHARLSCTQVSGSGNQQPRYVIEDLDSLSGVTVNGKLVKQQALANGDALRIGTAEYIVSIDHDGITLRAKRTETASAADPETPDARTFSPGETLPSMRLISWVLIALTCLGGVGYQLSMDRKVTWASGEITNHHKAIEADCTSCHQGNFSTVQDTACKSCHNVTDHNAIKVASHSPIDPELSSRADVERSPSPTPRSRVHHARLEGMACVSCHQEHNGAHALVPLESKQCVDCHSNLNGSASITELLNVTSWLTHPEFFGGKAPVDNGRIKMNHRVHMQPDLRGKDGPVTLQCSSCHQLSPNGQTMLPISRKNHCADCHSLGFEEQLPAIEVPHSPPDTVYQFLYAQYAQLLLAENDPVRGVTRQKPGATAPSPVEARRFAHAEVEQNARKAERELFTRTACKLCHEIAPADFILPDTTAGGVPVGMPRSAYKVLAPEVPARWMTKAKFSHVAHDAMTCQSCHGEVEKSEATSDVHMPKIAGCQRCHGGPDGAGHPSIGAAGGSFVKSECLQCHDFHESIGLAADKKLATMGVKKR